MFLTALDRLCPPHGPTSAKMYDTPLNGTSTDIGTERRIDDDHREPSPSTNWRELYRIHGVTPPDEPCTYPPETLAAVDDESRPLRNRRKHARRTTT